MTIGRASAFSVVLRGAIGAAVATGVVAAATAATAGAAFPGRYGGGGDLDWWDSLFVIGVLLAGRRHGRRGPPRR